MPLLRFDIVEGRSTIEITKMLDAAHRAVLSAFGVPVRDRYQIVHEHPASHLVVEDTGLGIARTDRVVILSVTSKKRPKATKESFTLIFAKNQKRAAISKAVTSLLPSQRTPRKTGASVMGALSSLRES